MSKSNKKTFNQNFLNRRSAYPSASSLGDGRGNSAAPQKSFAGSPHRPPDDVRAAAPKPAATRSPLLSPHLHLSSTSSTSNNLQNPARDKPFSSTGGLS